MITLKKRYYYKVYDYNYKYITTWSSDVISYPNFRTVLNGGQGELNIQLARPYNNFNEGIDVALGNRIELWVADNDNLNNNSLTSTNWDVMKWDVDYWDIPLYSWKKIYSGYISIYSSELQDEVQFINITVLGYITESSYKIVKDISGNTTLTYTSDPATIMKDLIDKYRSDGGTNLNYASNSISLTNTIVTYTFKDNTLKECFDLIVQMCPDNWYWFCDAKGIIYLKQSQIKAADHQVLIGRDISYLETNKRLENLCNRLFIIGGGNPNLFYRYDRTGSQTVYGIFEGKIQDGNVTDATTADLIAKRYLNLNQIPELRSIIYITDNNGENSNEGQDIESFQVGDTIQIKNINYGGIGITYWDNFNWDTGYWDSTINYLTASILIIVSIDYFYDHIEMEVSSRLPEVTKRIEQVNNTVNTLFQQNLPTIPTNRVV